MPLLLALARQKILFHKFKTLIIALPVAILTAIIIALSGWVGGMQYTIEKEVLEPIEQQKYLISVNESGAAGEQPSELKGVDAWSSIDEDLIAKALDIPGIVSITPNLSFQHFSSAVIDGLDKTLMPPMLATLDGSLAELYGVETFEYQQGQPIPIIVGEQFLRERRLGDKQQVFQSGFTTTESGFIETTDNSHLLSGDLVGKTGTLSFPLLPPTPQAVDVRVVRNRIVQSSEKSIITAEQLATYDQALGEVTAPYWNMESLNEPVQFRFEIVGIDKSGTYSSFIPEHALVHIMQSLHSRQQQARTNVEIPSELLQEQIYGSIIHENQIRFSNGFMSDFIITADKLEKPTFTIPGFFIEATKDADGNVTFTEVTEYQITKDSFVNPFLVARISDYSQLKRITTDLHNIGLYSSGISQFSEYEALFGLLMRALGIALAIISAIMAIILFILCWGYIADSNQEIGALRAYGLQLGDARWLVAWQLFLILTIGIVTGSLLGIGLMYGLSGTIAEVVNTKLLTSIGHSELLDGVTFAANDLTHINWQLAGLGVVAALTLPIISSVIASYKRLQLNPVEALKKDS